MPAKFLAYPQTVPLVTTVRRATRAYLQQTGHTVSELDDLPPYDRRDLPFPDDDDSDEELTSGLSPSAPSSIREPSPAPVQPQPSEPSASPSPPPSPPPSIRVQRHTMSTTVAKEFLEVSKLAADGQNYRLWIRRVRVAASACDGDDLLTAAPDDDSAKLHVQMRNAIMQKLPDAIFVKYDDNTTVASILTDLDKEFGQYTAAHEAWTEARLFSLKCTDERKVQQHLDKLAQLRKELGEMGTTIEEKTYINAITTSIPRSFSHIVTVLNTAVTLFNSTLPTGQTPRVVTASEIIAALRSEADTRNLQKPKAGERSKTVMTASTSRGGGNRGSGRGRSGGRGRGRGRGGASGKSQDTSPVSSDKDVMCFKCGGKGHHANVCPSALSQCRPAKPKESVSTAQASGSSADKAAMPNVAMASEAQSAFIEEVWSAISDEVAPGAFERVEIDCSELAEQCELSAFSPIPAVAAAADDTGAVDSDLRVDIYDSGASRHMTPH